MLTERIIVAYCIIDDLVKVLGHRDDPQSKTPASTILTIWVLAALEHGGKHNKALETAKDMKLFSYIPTASRFNRRLHSLSYLIPALVPLLNKIWQELEKAEYYMLDTIPIEVCDNIRAPRSKLAPDISYRGYIASKKRYFHGLKLHLVTGNNKFIYKFEFSTGSTSDLDGFYLLAFDLPEKSELYVDRGYTDYHAEDDLWEGDQLKLRPIRKSNSKRYVQHDQFMAGIRRKLIESINSSVVELFARHIHAVTLQGFVLKLYGFIFAYNLRLLAKHLAS